MDLLSMATRFRVNGLDVEKGLRSSNWWIYDRGMVYNHRTGEWDHEYAARHTDDKTQYFVERDLAIATAEKLPPSE
jgi:hypothetical protein